MKTVIGITGGIASGKSTVTNYLLKLGYEVIDTDKISHQITNIDNEGYIAIVNHFGNDILNADLSINRKKLGDLIFNDDVKRQQLNNILHPIIKKETIKSINNSNNDIIFLDVPLLFESKFNLLCNYTVVVYVDYKTQLQRLINRDLMTKEDADLRIKSQMSYEEKIKKADFIIDNNADYQNTYLQIDKIIEKIRRKEKCQEF